MSGLFSSLSARLGTQSISLTQGKITLEARSFLLRHIVSVHCETLRTLHLWGFLVTVFGGAMLYNAHDQWSQWGFDYKTLSERLWIYATAPIGIGLLLGGVKMLMRWSKDERLIFFTSDGRKHEYSIEEPGAAFEIEKRLLEALAKI